MPVFRGTAVRREDASGHDLAASMANYWHMTIVGEVRLLSWRNRRRGTAICWGFIAALLTGLLTAAPSAASEWSPRPGETERGSLRSGGDEVPAPSRSQDGSISADGRYVVFTGYGPHDDDDTNGKNDVFVHDRQTRQTELVSVASDGSQANDRSAMTPGRLAISADGRFVTFTSYATNLVNADTNGLPDAFVRDRVAGTTERVSVATEASQVPKPRATGSTHATISADGRYVAFQSDLALVEDDTNQLWDVYLHDRETVTTQRVSVSSEGLQAVPTIPVAYQPGAVYPSLSADARHIAFELRSAAFPTDPRPNVEQNVEQAEIYVHDRDTGETDPVSVSSDGRGGDARSMAASVSANGRYVAFYSDATNLVPEDKNGKGDVFVRDRERGITERVSVTSAGTESSPESLGAGTPPLISADGRFVAFAGFASGMHDLVPGGDGGQIYLHDRHTGSTEQASVGFGGPPDTWSLLSGMSPDARYVVFYSNASNLVEGDTNSRMDVFVRDRGPATGAGSLTVDRDGDGLAVSGWARFGGVTLAEWEDPHGDVDEQDAHLGGALGGDIVGASLTYRPEEQDVLVRIQLASLPGEACFLYSGFYESTGVSCFERGSPIQYSWSIHVGEDRYRFRAIKDLASDLDGAETTITVESCTAPHGESDCEQLGEVSGGIGMTGPEVRAAVPLDLLAAVPGTEITEFSATTKNTLDSSGPPVDVDGIRSEEDSVVAAIPEATVELGTAPQSGGEETVAFTQAADLVDGRFSGRLVPVPSDADRVWARACLGDICGSHWVAMPPGQ